MRELVTVAEITSTNRELAVEVPVPTNVGGSTQDSVINCDGPHTLRQRALTTLVGVVDDETMHAVCQATSYALGCG